MRREFTAVFLVGATFAGLALSLAACGDGATSADNAAAGAGTADTTTSFGDGGGKTGADAAAKPDLAGADAGPPAKPDADASVDQAAADAPPDPGAADLELPPDSGQPGSDSADTKVVAASCKDRCGKYDAKAPCQCDDLCKDSGDCCDDYAALCGSSASCKGDKDCDDFDPCTSDSCVAGACKHAGTGACCKTAGDCDDFDACTVDACTSSGCTNTAKDCSDGLGCTTDSCDSKTGSCSSAVQAGFCVIESNCRISGELDDTSCKACDPSKSQQGWTPKVGDACDDGSSCTTGDICDGNGNCAGKPKASCCKSDADCASSDACTAGSCNVAMGACAFSPKTGCCTVGTCCDLVTHTPKAAGAVCGSVPVAVDYACDGSLAQKRNGMPACDGISGIGCLKTQGGLAWTPWQTIATCTAAQKCVQQPGAPPTCVSAGGSCGNAADCDDKDPCTDDGCVGGACSNLAKKCPGGAPCQVGACNPTTGACGLAVAAGSCFIGGACVASGGKNLQDGCLTCQPTQSQTSWTLTSTCACTTGVCCNTQTGKIQPQGTACDTVVKATEYACSADGKAIESRAATQGCTGKSNTCSTSASNYAWSKWATVKTCGAGTTCEVTDPTQPGTCTSGADPLCGQPDPYEVGTTAKSAYDLGTFTDGAADLALSPKVLLGSATDIDVVKYTITDAVNASAPVVKLSWNAGASVKVCAWFACAAGAGGTACKAVICPSGSVSDTNALVSSVPGNGCCASGASGNLTWSPAPSTGTNANGTAFVSVGNASPACQQVALTVGFGAAAATPCKAGTTCCTSSGSFAAQGTACGAATVAAEYKCDGTAPGGKVLQRKAVQGCTGTSTTCSTSATNYAWSAWTTLQTCAANAVCSVTDPTQAGTCKPVSVCAPATTCCTAAGTWAAAGTACGSSAVKTEYQCSGTGLGAAAQVRKAFGGCSGTSATCSTASTSLVWSGWTSYQTCGASQTCVAGATNAVPPTCQTPAPNLCSSPDPSYGTTSAPSPKSLGSFADGDSAVWMAPKVALTSDTDKEYFKAQLFDDINLTDPKPSVTWSAPKPVTVCLFYQCTAGPNGKDCDKIQCPTGSTASANTSVSAVSPNGCCMDGASGALTLSPNAAGTTDETGWMHFSVANKAGSGCQQVAVKLSFGGNTATACAPGSTCCTDAGSWAAKGATCGSVQKTEYQCSKTTAGGLVQKREAFGSCGGGSAACSTATLAWGGWQTAKACTDKEFCATPVPTAAGICVSPGAGSCAGACGGKSKTGTCFCDATCATVGDCCSDLGAVCGGTCVGACGGKSMNGACWCDSLCSGKGDCCLDKAAKCGSP